MMKDRGKLLPTPRRHDANDGQLRLSLTIAPIGVQVANSDAKQAKLVELVQKKSITEAAMAVIKGDLAIDNVISALVRDTQVLSIATACTSSSQYTRIQLNKLY